MREDRSAEELSRAIYGTVLATALIAAYSEDPGSDPLQVAAATAVTAIVFWIAHAYAGLVARGGHSAEGLAAAREELASQWPLVLGAMPPTVPLLLGPLGVLSGYHAEIAAIVTGIVVLGAWGTLLPLRRGRGPVSILIGAIASAVFGLAVITLKALVH